MKIDFLVSQRLSINNQATIVSTYPLSNEEVIQIKKDIPSLAKAQITFTVDKNILAGVIIKIGSLVIDKSLKTKINKYLNHFYGSQRQSI